VKPRAFASRHELVARVRDRLLTRGAPRLQLSGIVILSGCAAFIASVVSLRLGLDSMAMRYPLAVVCGYLAFLVLIRSWIAWQRRSVVTEARDTAIDVASNVDLMDVSLPTRVPTPSAASLFTGGRSGGAGGGAHWAGAYSAPSHAASAAPKGLGFSLDLDELWFVVVAAACAIGGLLVIVYVIYTAPVLLAEVAIDAAVVSAVYRRLRREDTSHWVLTVVRHTWLQALALVVFAAVAGYALQRVAPEARSIGGVVRTLAQSR
jgi:hypothetical protein